MLVAVAAEGQEIRVLRRCRLELLPQDMGRFAYHEAAELPLPEAERLIERVRQAAYETALAAVGQAIGKLRVIRACIPASAAPVTAELSAVLRSHPRIHAAEGALYGGAINAACEHIGIPLITVREREVWSRASACAEMTEGELKARIAGLGKVLGPPWTADHKLATAAAIIRIF
jgi:hypothetical protein